MKRLTEANEITRMSRRKQNQSRYSSPLEELDARTRKWKPNKVRENNNYEQLCREGECSWFEAPPSSYQHFFINKKSTPETLEYLIEYARQVTMLHHRYGEPNSTSTSTIIACVNSNRIHLSTSFTNDCSCGNITSTGRKFISVHESQRTMSNNFLVQQHHLLVGNVER